MKHPTRLSPVFYANGLVIFLVLIALLAFFQLPWFGTTLPAETSENTSYEASGSEMLRYFYLWNTNDTTVAFAEALDDAQLANMPLLMTALEFDVTLADFYIALLVPTALLGALGLAVFTIARPHHAPDSRWIVLFCGSLIIGITLAWVLRGGLSSARVGLGIVAIVGLLLMANAFTPRAAGSRAMPPVPAEMTPTTTESVSDDTIPLLEKKDTIKAVDSAVLMDTVTGQRFPLSMGENTIGRASHNTIVSKEITVSRHHVLIHTENGLYTLHDQASRHGTKVNNTLVTGPVILQNNDLITLGDSVTYQFKTIS